MCEEQIYRWLAVTEMPAVRQALAHDFFYRAVRTSEVNSYQKHGIDPAFTQGRSHSAAAAAFEPSDAARFCTLKDIEVCLSAVGRGELVDPNVPEPDPRLLLRVPAQSVLTRSFGLDHSFSDMHKGFLSLTQGTRPLSAVEFVNLLRQFGAVSCFDVIPADEVTYSKQLDGLGAFFPLLSFLPRAPEQTQPK